MAYDRETADRLREALQGRSGLTEKAMFGGLAFLINGHMAVSVSGQGGLLLRCPPEDTDRLIEHPGIERFRMRGRETDGWLHVEPAVVSSDEDLSRWVAVGCDYAAALPAK